MAKFQAVFSLPVPTTGVVQATVTLVIEARTKEEALISSGIALDDLKLKRWSLTWIGEVE